MIMPHHKKRKYITCSLQIHYIICWISTCIVGLSICTDMYYCILPKCCTSPTRFCNFNYDFCRMYSLRYSHNISGKSNKIATDKTIILVHFKEECSLNFWQSSWKIHSFQEFNPCENTRCLLHWNSYVVPQQQGSQHTEALLYTNN